jgi:hypothetical protein
MKTAFLLVALVVPLASKESHSLVARPAEGDVFEERERFWSASSGHADDDAANRPSFAWSEAVARARSGADAVVARETMLEDEVLAVRDGARVKVRRTFVASRTTRVDPDAADPTPRQLSAAFEGQSIVLVRDGAETRLVGEIDGEEELAPSDLDLAPRWERALPEAAVEVGDTWTLSADVAARLLEPLAAREASAWCKLAAVETGETGPVARVQLEIHGTTSDPLGAATEIDASAVLRWDLAGGHLLEVALSGEARTMDGSEAVRRFGLAHETRRIE